MLVLAYIQVLLWFSTTILKRIPRQHMVAAIETAAEQYSNLSYNKAALKFVRDGVNDTSNSCCKAVDALIAISLHDGLLLPCYHFARAGVPINGQLYELYKQSEVVEKYWQSQGKLSVC